MTYQCHRQDMIDTRGTTLKTTVDGRVSCHSAPYTFRLYVAGKEQARSRRAVAVSNALLGEQLSGQYNLEIIDIQEHPHRAEADKVMATPMLVKCSPGKIQRFVGDFSRPDKVLRYFENLARS